MPNMTWFRGILSFSGSYCLISGNERWQWRFNRPQEKKSKQTIKDSIEETLQNECTKQSNTYRIKGTEFHKFNTISVQKFVFYAMLNTLIVHKCMFVLALGEEKRLIVYCTVTLFCVPFENISLQRA